LVRSPGTGNDNPLQYFLPGKLPGQRSLVGYSPWDCKESDLTEHAHMLLFNEISNMFIFCLSEFYRYNLSLILNNQAFNRVVVKKL